MDQQDIKILRDEHSSASAINNSAHIFFQQTLKNKLKLGLKLKSIRGKLIKNLTTEKNLFYDFPRS